MNTRPGEATDVGPVDDFPVGVPTAVRFEGREIVIVRWEDEIFALRNVCPHQSQSFVRGTIYHDVRATPDGEFHLAEPVLVCPWHNWPFSLKTGQCTVDRRKRVRTFDAQVADDRVLVRVDATGGREVAKTIEAEP